MKRPFTILLLVGLLLACGTAQQTRPNLEKLLPKEPVRGKNGAVAGGTNASVDAGMRMLKQGGNAVDAGVAAMFAAAVVEYSHFGFGGEAPILIRTKDGKVFSIAGVGRRQSWRRTSFSRSTSWIRWRWIQMSRTG
jgi:gamma-glutamyltranspeptidase/glutathione hydrolase